MQQVNNETVNLFRHIDKTKVGNKYLTLIAPYVHEDTKLIFSVASVITMFQTGDFSLYTDTLSIYEFVDSLKSENYFGVLKERSRDFIICLREKLNSITII